MKPHEYEVTVRGRLSDAALAAFADLTAIPSKTGTLLCGGIVDQAALYGVLERIEALGLELLDVRRTAANT